MASIRQDINVGLIAFIGIVGSMVLLILVLGVQGWYAYESDRIRAERYDADQNLDWINLKAEQYANIADGVGNDTIYADEMPGKSGDLRDELDDDDATVDADMTDGDYVPYRYLDEGRTRLAVPIHEAMAAVVRQNGGGEATAEQMREVDGDYVHLKNTAYADPQSHVEGRVPHEEAADPSGEDDGGPAEVLSDD